MVRVSRRRMRDCGLGFCCGDLDLVFCIPQTLIPNPRSLSNYISSSVSIPSIPNPFLSTVQTDWTSVSRLARTPDGASKTG